MRIPIIAGNWKLNKSAAETRQFVEEIKAKVPESEKVTAVIIPPVLAIADAVEAAKGTSLEIGAQNCFWEAEGAFTGETSPASLKEIGVSYVITGHSERREYFHETDEEINKKVKAILNSGMVPILCAGETLEEREAGDARRKVKDQILKALDSVSSGEAENVVVAYEPIWAIGTGKTASAKEAEEMCGWIREVLSELYSIETAEKIRIQYGGSVKPDNIKELMAQPNIDGALVGGASLEPESFIALLEASAE